MNILFCNYEYPPLGGGGGVMNAQIAEELVKKHQVTVLTSQGMELPFESVVNGVRVIRVPVFFRKRRAAATLQSLLAFMPVGIWYGRKLVRETKFDIINTHFALPSGPVGDALARYAGIPNVLSVHGGDLYDPSKFTSPHRHPYLRVWIRWLLRKADSVIANSKNTNDNIHRYYSPGIEAVRIPIGIRRPEIERVSRSKYGFSEDDVLLITVGRLVPRKAVQQLIALTRNLAAENVRLLVVGSGPEAEPLKALTRQYGLEDRVTFMGFVDEDEKYRLLGMSDVYVSTSQHEGFCISYLEAMAANLPIVCYDFGGHTDYLQDHVNGFLVPLNNQALFEDRVRLLIKNSDMRKSLSENNLRLVEDFFIDTCAAKYEGVFNQVLAREPQADRVSLAQSTTTGSD
jgi:glycosyltransferase involved in cell wall biosynthesis